MYKRLIILLLITVFIDGSLSAHSGKPKYHVVIDTDGAIDDMRALTMLLSADDIRVLAITCSQGTLLPDAVCNKVETLLSDFHHEGIPVGIGTETGNDLFPWSVFAQNVPWGNPLKEKYLQRPDDAIQILNRTIENYQEKITFIALGSLKTFADWMKLNPSNTENIEEIIWYNNPEIKEGPNYIASSEAYQYVKHSGIHLDIVGNTSTKYFINDSYLNALQNSNSIYARQIIKVHSLPEVTEKIQQQHLKLWDDLVPLYLTAPILFDSETKGNSDFVKLSRGIPDTLIFDIISKLLGSGIITNNRVFNTFPVDTALYKAEYAKILPSTISKFGLIEWKAICMTNEVHGHTGIYSIIGAKMGVRAMDFFNVGVNNLTVVSFAGNKPPLSCFNDGIQISTGATIGQGLITVSDSISVIPTAIFEFNNQRVKVSLKKEIATQMQRDIKVGVQTYGLLTEKYWLYIEELAIRYWCEYNRFEIFDIEFI